MHPTQPIDAESIRGFYELQPEDEVSVARLGLDGLIEWYAERGGSCLLVEPNKLHIRQFSSCLVDEPVFAEDGNTMVYDLTQKVTIMLESAAIVIEPAADKKPAQVTIYAITRAPTPFAEISVRPLRDLDAALSVPELDEILRRADCASWLREACKEAQKETVLWRRLIGLGLLFRFISTVDLFPIIQLTIWANQLGTDEEIVAEIDRTAALAADRISDEMHRCHADESFIEEHCLLRDDLEAIAHVLRRAFDDHKWHESHLRSALEMLDREAIAFQLAVPEKLLPLPRMQAARKVSSALPRWWV